MSNTEMNNNDVITTDAAGKKKKRSRLATAMMCGTLFVGGLSLMIAGINAYLTNTDTVTNTFTVGEVTIDTIEPNFPGNGSDEVSDLVALEEVPKDPQIRNTGKNRAIVYQRVDIPMANIIVADGNGNRFPRANTELFGFRTTTGDFNSFHHEKWVLLSEEYRNADDSPASASTAAKMSRLYGYSTVLEEDETTLPVFDIVRLCNVIEREIDNSIQNIVITTYAIQADNIMYNVPGHDEYVTSQDWHETMSKEKLLEIFDIWMNQSADVIPDQADSEGKQTLINTTLNITMTIQNTHLRLNSGDPADAKTITLYNVAYTGPNEAPIPKFTSSNPGVATVDQNGNINAVSVGTTTITMTATNPDTGKEAVARVTVSVRDMNPGEN